MASQLQLLIYEGFLAADPEMHYTPKGQGVTNFRMGSNSSYKNGEGEEVKEVTWLKVTCWGKLGEIANQWTEKGSQVIIVGKLRPGKNGSPTVYNLSNGDPAASYEVTAEKLRIISGKKGAPTTEVVADVVPDSGEIPF